MTVLETVGICYGRKWVLILPHLQPGHFISITVCIGEMADNYGQIIFQVTDKNTNNAIQSLWVDVLFIEITLSST